MYIYIYTYPQQIKKFLSCITQIYCAYAHIDTHSTSMPKVLCTFQTLFSPLLNLAACCSHLCLPS